MAAVYSFYEFQEQIGAIETVDTYHYQYQSKRKYKSLLHHINKSKPVKKKLLKLKEPKAFPGTLSREQVKQLIEACNRIRDKFLICLLYETGVRIGEALGLRHEDIKSMGKSEIHVVPRNDNFNHARSKSGTHRVIHTLQELMSLYSEYLIEEYPEDIDCDYVFVNIWEKEIAEVVQQQQSYIREELDPKFPYLFCARKRNSEIFIPALKPMSYLTFRRYLKKLAFDKNIRDVSGNIFPLEKIHRFRHTVGTNMINNGVPIHVVKRFFGHESFRMTERYAHLHDETLKQAIDEYYGGKVVNITGEVVISTRPELDTGDMQWFKKNIQAQALANGYCGLPKTLDDCPHANACLTCGHFRTTTEFLEVHKLELSHTNRIIEKAKSNGWERQIEAYKQRLVLASTLGDDGQMYVYTHDGVSLPFQQMLTKYPLERLKAHRREKHKQGESFIQLTF